MEVGGEFHKQEVRSVKRSTKLEQREYCKRINVRQSKRNITSHSKYESKYDWVAREISWELAKQFW